MNLSDSRQRTLPVRGKCIVSSRFGTCTRFAKTSVDGRPDRNCHGNLGFSGLPSSSFQFLYPSDIFLGGVVTLEDVRAFTDPPDIAF